MPLPATVGLVSAHSTDLRPVCLSRPENSVGLCRFSVRLHTVAFTVPRPASFYKVLRSLSPLLPVSASRLLRSLSPVLSHSTKCCVHCPPACLSVCLSTDCCVHCLLACLFCEMLSMCSAVGECLACGVGGAACCDPAACCCCCMEVAGEAACTEEACQAVLDCGILEDCCGSSDCLEICLECCSICFPT